MNCVWRGDFGAVHSLAVVNDGHTGVLEGLGWQIERLATDAPASASTAVGVSQQWPPRFEAPSAGPFVVYLPWEFGPVPKRWIEPLRRRVDEIWVPSAYVREGYLASGIAPELVHVVPNGVDLAGFTPDGPRRKLADAGTVFLYVGGTVERKALDVLLAAYARAFTADDDVALVVKTPGGKNYRPLDEHRAVAAFRRRESAPRLVELDVDLAPEELPALYRGADVLVQAYRGEGFCLPALEALACGVPVIVTAGGPTDDFVTPAAGWKIPAERRRSRTAVPASYETVETPWLLEPDETALVAALREAANPQARAARAANARAHAEPFAWDRVAGHAAERLEALAGVEPVRTVHAAAVAGRRRTLFTASGPGWPDALRSYIAAFGSDDPVTLAIGASDPAEAYTVAAAELEGATDVPDVTIVPFEGTALELAADVTIGSGPRSRRRIHPDPDALRQTVAKESPGSAEYALRSEEKP